MATALEIREWPLYWKSGKSQGKVRESENELKVVREKSENLIRLFKF